MSISAVDLLIINFRRCKGTAKKKQKPPTQWVRVGGTDYRKRLIISLIVS